MPPASYFQLHLSKVKIKLEYTVSFHLAIVSSCLKNACQARQKCNDVIFC